MDLARELLRERYVLMGKEDDQLHVGIQLAFPIVNLAVEPVDFSVIFELFNVLVDELPFSIEKTDINGQVIQIVSEEFEDRISFKGGYNTLNFSFEKSVSIGTVEKRFNLYLGCVQDFLKKQQHLLTGIGVNPFWQINDNRPVACAADELLAAYLRLNETSDVTNENSEQFPAFIQNSQVVLDISEDQLVSALNIFNAIEPVKAWLFANSYLWDTHSDTLVVRDRFMASSKLGYFSENVGVFSETFADIDEYLDYLTKTPLFFRTTEQESYYFNPIQVFDYFNHDEIIAYNLAGEDCVLIPSPYDFYEHKGFQNQRLTSTGTLEFSGNCIQPISDSFTVAAFHLGLMVNLPLCLELIKHHSFYEDYGRDYKQLRARFSARDLSDEEMNDIALLAKDLLDIAFSGLEKRGFDETDYLLPLYERVNKQENPASLGLRLFESGKTLVEISDTFSK